MRWLSDSLSSRRLRFAYGFALGAAIIVCAAWLSSSGAAPPAKKKAPPFVMVEGGHPGFPEFEPPANGGPKHISRNPRAFKEVTYWIEPPADQPQDISHFIDPDETDEMDWGHSNMKVPSAWKTATGKGVKVAVLDTGADHDHRDLVDQILDSKDFTNSRSGANDVHGHGTHTAGTVAAARNETGLVGVAPDAKLLIGKVLSDRGSGSNFGITQGIDWAVEQGADVISMSLGGPSPDEWTHEAIKRAVARGVIVVCSAGNSGPREDSDGWPARYPESVSVAASDSNNLIARFSSRGSSVIIAAPGVNVRSCYPGDRYATMSGTSMACPHVAGAAALYVEWARANGVKPSADDFKARLAKAAQDLAPPGRDTASGYGLLLAPGLFDAPKQPPVDPKLPERIEFDNPGLIWNGRPVKRIIIEFLPPPKVIEERETAPAPRGKCGCGPDCRCDPCECGKDGARQKQTIVSGVVAEVQIAMSEGRVTVLRVAVAGVPIRTYDLTMCPLITVDGRRVDLKGLVDKLSETSRYRVALTVAGGAFGLVTRADFACHW